jgi:hypothetical protein
VLALFHASLTSKSIITRSGWYCSTSLWTLCAPSAESVLAIPALISGIFDCRLSATQAPERSGVRVAVGTATQTLGLAFIDLLQTHLRALRRVNEVGPRHIEQATVGRMLNHLLFHCRVDNRPIEFGRRGGFHLYRGGVRRQQLHDTGFAQLLPEANKVARIAWQARLPSILRRRKAGK